MKEIIQTEYIDDEWEEYTTFIIDGKTVLEGDEYHNKIHARIQGYLSALDPLSYRLEIRKVKIPDIGFVATN